MPTEDELLRLYREALESAALWEHRADGYRVMLEGLRMVRGDDLAAAKETVVAQRIDSLDDPPANREEAILRIMRTDPERPWSPAMVHTRLISHGWAPRGAEHPARTVAATMSRMRAKGLLVRETKGMYLLPPALTTGGT
jgi:hypothetical protein